MQTTRINKIVQIRIVPTYGGYFEGYIFIKEQSEKEGKDSLLLDKEIEAGWYKVTEKCYTRSGCKKAVKNWVKDHTIIEVSITVSAK